MGAWIEIRAFISPYYKSGSLLSWERGLKSSCGQTEVGEMHVAPLVGAWIEIKLFSAVWYKSRVAPLVGAWIEISINPI